MGIHPVKAGPWPRPAHMLLRRQRVSGGPHETVAFFERPENLPRITPPWLDLRVLTPGPITMARGLVVES